MLVSILHRVTGSGLGVVGAILLVWWLYALASGPASYETFRGVAAAWYGQIVLIAMSWAFFQHLATGMRHFVLDMGAGYELKANRFWSVMTLVLSVLATVLLWFWIYFGKAL